MLVTELQASKPNSSEEEDFLIFFYVFLWLEPTTPGQKPSWTLGPTFEQNWKRTIRQCYNPNFKHLSQVIMKKKFLNIFLCISMV